MTNIKNIFAYLNKFVIPLQFIATVTLIYQFYTFKPTAKIETVEKKHVEKPANIPNLGTKGSFIYFDGKFEGKGWFFTDNLAKFQSKNNYLQILYPVVEKRFLSDKLNIN